MHWIKWKVGLNFIAKGRNDLCVIILCWREFGIDSRLFTKLISFPHLSRGQLCFLASTSLICRKTYRFLEMDLASYDS